MGLETIIAVIVLAVIVIIGLKGKFANSPSVVVTGPGVVKTHDVEARFRTDGPHRMRLHGKLKQSRWSDGQERFSLRISGLPGDHGGKLRLIYRNRQVSEFDVSGGKIDFRWKGMSSEAIPQFAIGEEVRVEAGSTSITALVEAD